MDDWMIRGVDNDGVVLTKFYSVREQAVEMLLTMRAIGYRVDLWERRTSWVLLTDIDI